MNKRWSYSQITKATEERITQSMTLANEARDDHQRHNHQMIAWGHYFLWYSLTMGWQNEGDATRMEAMTRVKTPC